MIIGENNIIQTGYEPHLHRRRDSRAYLNPRFESITDNFTRSMYSEADNYISSATPEFQTMESALLEARKLSKELIPFYFRFFLNSFLFRVNDFTLNGSKDFKYASTRNTTSVKEQIYEPIVYKKIDIKGISILYSPYRKLEFSGVSYGGENPKNYGIKQGLIENSANTEPKYLNELKDFAIRINSVLFPTNERFKADKEIYKTSFKGNGKLPTMTYSPEYFDLMKEINLSNSVGKTYYTPKEGEDLLLDNTDEAVVTKDPIIYFSEFDPLKMTYDEFKSKVKKRAVEYSRPMHEYSESTAKQNGINYEKSISNFGEYRYSLSDYVPKNLFLKRNSSWGYLHIEFSKFALYVAMTDLYKVGFGTDAEDRKILVSPNLFRERLIKLKKLLRKYIDKVKSFQAYTVSSSERIGNPWFSFFHYSNPNQGNGIGPGTKITNVDIGEFIFNSLNRKMMSLVSLNPFKGWIGFEKPNMPLFYCGDELNDSQVKLYKVSDSPIFNLITPEIFVYSGDSVKLTSDLSNTGTVTLGDEEVIDLLFNKKGYSLARSTSGLTSSSYEDEKIEEELSGKKGPLTWFMEEFNKLYSVEQHRYKTLLNAIFEIVSKSALNNLRYGVLSGEALKKYKSFSGIEQDDEIKILFLLAKTKDKNKRTHNIPLDNFYKLVTEPKYQVHGYKNKISNKNALMLNASEWSGKLSEDSYLDGLRTKILALPDQVLKWEHIKLIVEYVFYSVLHNIGAPDNPSSMPDPINQNDSIDSAVDKYMRGNLLENISTWRDNIEHVYKEL
jgi:hypothetical protein